MLPLQADERTEQAKAVEENAEEGEVEIHTEKRWQVEEDSFSPAYCMPYATSLPH